MPLIAGALLLVGQISSAQAIPIWQINTAYVAARMTGHKLVLDAAGYPFIVFTDAANEDLKLLHCNDALCRGNDEHVQTVDSVGNVGWHPSLILDAAGYPVISYVDADPHFDLKLVHCNDVNCQGDDESIQTVDSAGFVGEFSSL